MEFQPIPPSVDSDDSVDSVDVADAGHPSSPEEKPSPSIWRRLYRPMLVASLLLHGFVLVVPFPPRPEVEEEPEEETIDLAALAAISAQSPTPTPTPTPTPIPTPTPQAIVPSPVPLPAPAVSVPAPLPIPAPTPLPAATPTLAPSEAPPSPAAPAPAPAAAPAPATVSAGPLTLTPEQLAALQAQLLEQSQRLAQGDATEQGSLQVPVNCGELKDHATDFCDGDQFKPGIFYPERRPNQDPSQALEHFQQAFSNYRFTDTGRQYSNSPLYEVRSQDNTALPPFYLSVVDVASIGRTSIGLFWLTDPTQPQP